MSIAKKLVLIGLGYAFAIAGGFAAVALDEFLTPVSIPDTSSGTNAFGDMILFIIAAGALGLAPTWFLLKLSAEKTRRTLFSALLVLAVLGPLSWLAMTRLFAGGPIPYIGALLGPNIAYVCLPRIVAGPILVAVEGLALFFARNRLARMALVAAMLMDLVPLSLFAAHIWSASAVSSVPSARAYAGQRSHCETSLGRRRPKVDQAATHGFSVLASGHGKTSPPICPDHTGNSR